MKLNTNFDTLAHDSQLPLAKAVILAMFPN